MIPVSAYGPTRGFPVAPGPFGVEFLCKEKIDGQSVHYR